MQKPAIVRGLSLLVVLGGGGAFADVWDTQGAGGDDSSSTDNALAHGTVQIHDLAASPPGVTADQDWYQIRQAPTSSYEFVLDGLTADLVGAPSVRLDRVDSAGIVIQGHTSFGRVLSLAFANDSESTVTDEWVRVSQAECQEICSANDQYTIHFFETTYAIPRFNNSGTQTTSVILQNTGDANVFLGMHFWDPTGSLLGTFSFDLPAKVPRVINTAATFPSGPNMAGQSGAITISNDGRYGQLSGKAVALEPATGFTFDTPLLPKAH